MTTAALLALVLLQSHAAAPAVTPAAAAPAPAKPGWTGAASEEEFKRMHELKADESLSLRGTMVDLAGGKAYLSLPEGGTPGMPAIVVIQEWWGLNSNIKHWADRLAGDGYAALAVDLYDGQMAGDPDKAMELMQGARDERCLEIVKAAHAFLASDPRIMAKRRGSIGWCFGGHWSMRLAMAAPDLDAAVMYYGKPVTDVEQLKTIKASLLGVWGNLDKGIPPAMVKEFDKALTTAQVKHEFLRYDAVHAFANPSNAKYDQISAGDAWEKVRAFLAASLK